MLIYKYRGEAIIKQKVKFKYDIVTLRITPKIKKHTKKEERKI